MSDFWCAFVSSSPRLFKVVHRSQRWWIIDLFVCCRQESGSASDSEAKVHSSRLLMTSSSPHLAMFGYQRTVSAPAGTGGSQPALVAVDPGQVIGIPASHLSSPAFDMRPHTISSAYERYHGRSTVSAATFEPPPALRAPPPAIHRPSSGPSIVHTHRHLGAPVRPIRPQQPQRDEVIYQSVLRTASQQPQQTVNNGTCDTTPGILSCHQQVFRVLTVFIPSAFIYIITFNGYKLTVITRSWTSSSANAENHAMGRVASSQR